MWRSGIPIGFLESSMGSQRPRLCGALGSQTVFEVVTWDPIARVYVARWDPNVLAKSQVRSHRAGSELEMGSQTTA